LLGYPLFDRSRPALRPAVRTDPRRFRHPARQARDRSGLPGLHQHRTGVLSRRRQSGPTPETQAEPPPEAARRRRGVLGWALIIGSVRAVLLVAIVSAGGLAVLTPAGRDLVVGFVAGPKIGRYGRINVEGLS